MNTNISMKYNTVVVALMLLLSGWFSSASARCNGNNCVIATGKTIHIYLPWPAGDAGVMVWDNDNYPMTDPDGDNWYSVTFTEDLNEFMFLGLDANNGAEWNYKITTTGYKAGSADNVTISDTKFGNDIFGASNQVWVMPQRDGAHGIYYNPPGYIHVLNPEDWNLTAPMVVINGGDPQYMTIDKEHCGWFSYMFLDADPVNTEYNMYLVDVQDKEPFGADFGYGDVTPWNISQAWVNMGTFDLWIEPEDNVISADFPDIYGECTYKMATIVRDFPSSHPDFETKTCDELQTGMVSSTLVNYKPTVGSNKCAARFDWFEDAAALSTECRDLTFEKSSDGLWEYDSFWEPSGNYFPIDDVGSETFVSCVARPKDPEALDLADPTTVTGDDFQWFTEPSYPMNGQHNFHFCMETHAQFVYKKGQIFSFRGDDDVWVYINNQLVVDLGGTHIPLPTYVELDDLNLVEGQTYNFDLFMCERKTCGSNLRMKSTIYFEQKRGLYVNPTPAANGGTQYEVCKSEQGGGDCASILNPGNESKVECGPALGSQLVYTLITSKGDSVNMPDIGIVNGNVPTGAVYFKGVDLTNPGFIVYDEDKISGLAPGRYRLIVSDAADGTLKDRITIRVAGNLTILNDEAQSAVAGELIPVIIASATDDGQIDTEMDMGYVLSYTDGLRVYKDAAGTQLVALNEQMQTSGGVDTVWVTGLRSVEELAKEYSISIQRGKGQPKVITFYLPQLQFVESMTLPAVPMADPKANFDTWALKQYPVYIEAFTPTWGHCGVCNDTLRVVQADSGLTFFTANGSPTSFVVMKDGLVTLNVSSDIDVTDASFTLQGPSSLITITLTGITLKVPPVAKVIQARMYDINADGKGDSLVMVFDKPITGKYKLDSLEIFWPTPDADDSTATGEWYIGDDILNYLSGNDSTLVFVNAEGFSPGILTGKDGSVFTYVTFEDEDTGETFHISPSYLIQEQIPPLAIEAILRISEKNTFDTLVVVLSELMQVDSIAEEMKKEAFDFIMYRDVPYRDYRLPATLSIWSGDTAKLVFNNALDLYPAAGDSIRLAAGAGLPVDLKGIGASPFAAYIVIEGEKRSEIATYQKPFVFDPNGSAYIEKLEKQGPIYTTKVGQYTSLEDIIEKEEGSLGWLIKDDLRDIYISASKAINLQGELLYPDLQPEEVVLHYTVSYFSSLGSYVASQQQKIPCNDALFNGDCTEAANNGFVFLGWNFASDDNRFVGNGAYVTILDKKVSVRGNVWRGTDKNPRQIWGVLRGQNTTFKVVN